MASKVFVQVCGYDDAWSDEGEGGDASSCGEASGSGEVGATWRWGAAASWTEDETE